MNKRVLGDMEEIITTKFLEDNGYEILCRNFRCKIGEIDIIAKNDGYLVFIEVKYRTTIKYGTPGMAINYKKQNTIMKVAQFYMSKNDIQQDMPVRFDAVLVLGNNIEIIKNAFGTM